MLQTEPNWQQCLADAIGRREELHELADDEHRNGAAYLRPIVLIQSEPRRAGVETLDFERVRQELGSPTGRATPAARPGTPTSVGTRGVGLQCAVRARSGD